MADKMMRMAGRSEDGLAKAIATNDAGELITTPSDRIIELARYSGSIEPGNNYELISNVDTSGVVFYFILSRFNGSVHFTGQWMVGSVAYTNELRVFSTIGRAPSEWLEVKGRSLKINIVNEDELPQTGHFIIYGVR